MTTKSSSNVSQTSLEAEVNPNLQLVKRVSDHILEHFPYAAVTTKKAHIES